MSCCKATKRNENIARQDRNMRLRERERYIYRNGKKDFSYEDLIRGLFVVITEIARIC